MSETLIYSAKVCPQVTKVKSSGGNYQVDSFQVGDCIIAPGGRLGKVTSVHPKIGITWENGHFGEYTLKQMQAWNYQKFLQEKEVIAPCQDSNNLTSAQELGRDSALLDFAQDANLWESQKLMNTAQTSLQNGSPMSATTATCEASQSVTLAKNGEKSTCSQLRHPANPSQFRASDKEKTIPATVSQLSAEQLNQSLQDSSALKMCQDSSPVAETPVVKHSIFSTSCVRLPSSATMRNGFVSAQDTLPAPSLENGYCWLESPGALSSTGKGRPPGQSRLEAQLKQHGLLEKKEVLRPDFLLNGYNLPPSYLDPSDCRPAMQLLEECDRQQEIFSIPESPPSPLTESSTSIPCLENQQLQQLKAITLHQPYASLVGIHKFFDRSWSTKYRGKIAIHAAKQQKDSYYKWSLLSDLLPPFKELVFGSVLVIADLTDCILMTPEFIAQQSETELRCGLWEPGRYAWKLENVQILEQPIPAKGKQRLWEIDLGLTVAANSGNTPTKFLRETQAFVLEAIAQIETIPEISKVDPPEIPPTPELFTKFVRENTTPPKKIANGSLAPFLENKKLKSGEIVTYPRVEGERDKLNYSHWRWGYYHEVKIDGEWKNRSIPVPVKIAPLVRQMIEQNYSVEEIKSFILQCKNKKK